MKSSNRSEADGWSTSGAKITSAENASAIRAARVDGSIIVERWIYRGASAPDRLMFDDAEQFEGWLRDKTSAGDSIYVWAYSDVCRDDNAVAAGKRPDDDGEVPARGAY